MSANAREAFNQRFQHYDGYRTEARQDDLFTVFKSGMQYAHTQDPSDAEVEAVAESYEPGLFSLSDHHYSIKFDNPAKYRATHQGLSIADARDALTAARNARMGN